MLNSGFDSRDGRHAPEDEALCGSRCGDLRAIFSAKIMIETLAAHPLPVWPLSFNERWAP